MLLVAKLFSGLRETLFALMDSQPLSVVPFYVSRLIASQTSYVEQVWSLVTLGSVQITVLLVRPFTRVFNLYNRGYFPIFHLKIT
ncbi:hypothetical protein KSS87_011610 [Heliosperma pusillum]|nr:hypothetical protein KSS87_011610 [Heliosperma pusillum]